MLENYLDFNSGLRYETDLMEKCISESASKISKQKEEIINNKLIEKGFPPLSEFLIRERFPRINISKQNDWEYFFADNGSKNGVFLGAFRTVFDNSFELNNYSVKATVTLEFQDKDCSSVLF